MQNGQFRTSCRSSVLHQFCKRFVLYIATAALFKFIFRLGASYESDHKIEEAQYLYPLPGRPKLRRLLESQNNKGSLQKTHRRRSTSCRKVWWLDNVRSQSPQWEMWTRDNHRYVSWCKTWPRNGFNLIRAKERLHMRRRSLSKFLESSHRPKVVNIDNSMEFGKACEDLAWNHRTSTPHRSETNDIAERAVRRVKEGTSAVLLQSGLTERW